MIVGIMQPYFFPYIGYWQLLNIVDTFVIYDDVNYIKKGYINKNSILLNGNMHSITLELMGASQNKLINEIEVGYNNLKLFKTISLSYKKAPYYDKVLPIIEAILFQDEKNLAKFLGYSLKVISSYLNITTEIIYSSNINKNCALKGEDKIIEICQLLGASEYINAIGGQKLYSKERFNSKNIKLSFLETEIVEYKQFSNAFIPYLSIIDIMMFNDRSQIRDMMKGCIKK